MMALRRNILSLLYYLLPLPLAWGTQVLLGEYWRYYDIGINRVANAGFLLLIFTPLLLAFLYLLAVLVPWLLRWRAFWQGRLAGVAAMLLVCLGAFSLALWHCRDYPTEEPQSVAVFLQALFRQSPR